MKISIKHNKSLMKNFIFCAVENEVIWNMIIVTYSKSLNQTLEKKGVKYVQR